MQLLEWIEQAEVHFLKWVEEYTETGEGKRLLSHFKNLQNDQLFEMFVNDFQHRIGNTDEEQRKFWEALRRVIGDDLPLQLALIEPLAQCDSNISKLVSLFPEDLSDPSALVKAIDILQRGIPALPQGITNTAGWGDQKIVVKLTEVKATLDWENTTGNARKWWEAFEKENKQRLALVLRLAEELAVRKATITEFFLAYVYSNTDNIQANLSYLDYTRLKKEEERKKKNAAENIVAGVLNEAKAAFDLPSNPSHTLPPGITATKGWTDAQLRQKLEEVKTKLDWQNTTGSAKKWWEAFEKENEQRLALLLRLAEELAVRKATITEFFLAYVYSNTDNIQANLSYLDYTRLKKQEDRKKKEADERANEEKMKKQQAVAAKTIAALIPKLSDGHPLPELSEDEVSILKHAVLDEVNPEVIARLKEAISLAEARIATEG